MTRKIHLPEHTQGQVDRIEDLAFIVYGGEQ